MRTLLISYDLVGTEETSQDYEDLIAAIEAYGTYAKVNKSVWIIRTNNTVSQVFDDLRQHMDGNDRLFVIRTYREAAWTNALCTNDWLQKNLQN